jgi:hypothetical protein
VAHALVGIGALEDHGVLAVCDDQRLCAGDTGEDLVQLPLPAGQEFGGLHVRKPLYAGTTPDDFMLLTRSGAVLRRRGGGFVADALPAAYGRPSDASWGISGFTRNGAATYVFLGHADGNTQRVTAFRLTGDCWKWVSAPLSLVTWGAADGSMHFLDIQNDVTCALSMP